MSAQLHWYPLALVATVDEILDWTAAAASAAPRQIAITWDEWAPWVEVYLLAGSEAFASRIGVDGTPAQFLDWQPFAYEVLALAQIRWAISGRGAD